MVNGNRRVAQFLHGQRFLTEPPSGSCTTATNRPAEVEMEMAEDTSPISAEKDELREDASCKNMVSEP